MFIKYLANLATLYPVVTLSWVGRVSFKEALSKISSLHSVINYYFGLFCILGIVLIIFYILP